MGNFFVDEVRFRRRDHQLLVGRVSNNRFEIVLRNETPVTFKVQIIQGWKDYVDARNKVFGACDRQGVRQLQRVQVERFEIRKRFLPLDHFQNEAVRQLAAPVEQK